MKILLFLVLTSLSATACFANGANTKGTEFWAAYMQNFRLDMNYYPEFSFIISAEQYTRGTISMPLGSLEIDFEIQANETKEIFLPIKDPSPNNPTVYYPIGSEFIDTTGFKIVTDNPVNVFIMHYRSYFSDASIVLPKEALGNKYMVLAAKDYLKPKNDPSQLIIVGTENNTILEITPSCITRKLKPAGVPFTIILNKGEVYQIQSTYTAFDPSDQDSPGNLDHHDLTGTIIKSLNNKNFAVFSGAKSSASINERYNDHQYHQNYPIDDWGNLFAFIPFKGRGGDIAKILALEDSTVVKFDCRIDTILNSGEYYRRMISVSTIISSNKKIALAQISKPNFYCVNRCGDPSLAILPPLNFKSNKALFKSSNDAQYAKFSNHYVNIVASDNARKVLYLDNDLIKDEFVPLSSLPGYYFAQIDLEGGSHCIESEFGFYAYSYGCMFANAYAYHLGSDFKVEFNKYGLSLPDTNAFVGMKEFKIPIRILVEDQKIPLSIEHIRIFLQLDSRSYHFSHVTEGAASSDIGSEKTFITIYLNNLNISRQNQVITEISGTVLLPEEPITPVSIDSVYIKSHINLFPNLCSEPEFENGSIEIKGCIIEMKKINTFSLNSMSLFPLPVNNILSISTISQEYGLFRIEIYGVDGQRYHTTQWFSSPESQVEKRSIKINVKDYPQGIFYIVFKTPNEIITRHTVKVE